MREKILLSLLTLLACVSVSEALGGVQFLPVAIKPAGVLVVIDGRAYYWSGEGSFIEKPNEGATIKSERLQWWNRKLPPLRNSDKKVEIIQVMGGGKIRAPKGEDYWRIGGKIVTVLLVGDHKHLSVDDEGRVIVVTEKEALTNNSAWIEKLTDRSAWVEKKIGGRLEGDDAIAEYEFTHPGSPKDKQHLGIGDKPLVLKDKDGKDHEFYPLILTEPKKAARFLVNDYSGK